MSTSLFEHLALRFGSHPENLATEGLAYILDGSKSARADLLPPTLLDVVAPSEAGS